MTLDTAIQTLQTEPSEQHVLTSLFDSYNLPLSLKLSPIQTYHGLFTPL